MSTATTGTHKHKCRCGHIWEHGDDMLNNRAAHTCYKCGKVCWVKWFGDEVCDAAAYCCCSFMEFLDALATLAAYCRTRRRR
jgi:hypothetical protein